MNVNHRQRRRFGACLAVVAALTSGTVFADIYVGKGVESGVSATRGLEVVVEATPFTMTAEDRRLTELAVAAAPPTERELYQALMATGARDLSDGDVSRIVSALADGRRAGGVSDYGEAVSPAQPEAARLRRAPAWLREPPPPAWES